MSWLDCYKAEARETIIIYVNNIQLHPLGISCFGLLTSHFIHSEAVSTGPVPIERAFKTDILSILVVHQ